MTLYRNEDSRNLFDLLWLFHQCDCFVKKDGIAALYGFIPPQLSLLLDYKSNYISIFKQQAMWLVNDGSAHEMLLHLFYFGPVPAQAGLHSLSWIPDWSNKRGQPAVIGFPTPSQPNFRSLPLIPEAHTLFHSWRKRRPTDALRNGRASSWELWRTFLYDIRASTRTRKGAFR